MKKLCVVMPALNEEQNLKNAVKHTLDGFAAYDISGEVLIVNDGSTDQTGSIAKALMQEFPDTVRMIEHEYPMGVGRSFWDGVFNTEAESAVMFPGDDENDPVETLRYLSMLDHVDIVVPFIYNKNVRSFFRNILSSAFRCVINMTFRTNFHYTNGTVLYRRKVLLDLKCVNDGFFYQAEILIKAAKKGYLYAEVPARLSRRNSGASKAMTLRALRRVIGSYFRLIKEIYFVFSKSEKNIAEDSATYRREHRQ